jgi:hypothetical protein
MTLRALTIKDAIKRGAFFAGVSLLAACTTVSKIDSAQSGQLVLTSKARCPLTTWNHVRNVGLHRAEAYCRGRNAQLHTIAVHTYGVWSVTDQTVEIIFECV